MVDDLLEEAAANLEWAQGYMPWSQRRRLNPLILKLKEANKVADEPILKYFAYAHLPDQLRGVSQPFCDLAEELVSSLPQCAERSVALRKLLEAKDAAVRSALS